MIDYRARPSTGTLTGGPRHQRTQPGVSADALDDYLAHIGTYPRLDASQEVTLAHVIQRGRHLSSYFANPSPAERDEIAAGDRARTTFIEANLGLVVCFARHYTGRGMDLIALVQEGNIGLCRAVDEFDPDRGCKFSTYASWPIRHAVAAGVARQGRAVRLPDHVLDHVNTVLRETATLTAQLGRAPYPDELARTCRLPHADVTFAQTHASTTVSLSVIVDDDGTERGDLLADTATDPTDVQVETAMLADDVARALSTLTPIERQILTWHYGLGGDRPLDYCEIATRVGLNRHRVSTLATAALQRLCAQDSDGQLHNLLSD